MAAAKKPIPKLTGQKMVCRVLVEISDAYGLLRRIGLELATDKWGVPTDKVLDEIITALDGPWGEATEFCPDRTATEQDDASEIWVNAGNVDGIDGVSYLDGPNLPAGACQHSNAPPPGTDGWRHCPDCQCEFRRLDPPEAVEPPHGESEG